MDTDFLVLRSQGSNEFSKAKGHKTWKQIADGKSCPPTVWSGWRKQRFWFPYNSPDTIKFILLPSQRALFPCSEGKWLCGRDWLQESCEIKPCGTNPCPSSQLFCSSLRLLPWKSLNQSAKAVGLWSLSEVLNQRLILQLFELPIPWLSHTPT